MVLVLALMTVAAAGCGGKDAKSVMVTYLDALVKGDYNAAYGVFTSKVHNDITADAFARAMEAEAEAKGPIVRYEIRNVETHGALSTIITVDLFRRKGSDPETTETKVYGFTVEQGWKLGSY